MTSAQWRQFFEICASVLGEGHVDPNRSNSWCAWTTLRRLKEDSGYWAAGLPSNGDIKSDHIGDGGVWGQPFSFADLAHIVLPATFENSNGDIKHQDLSRLANRLSEAGIPFSQSRVAIEVKLY